LELEIMSERFYSGQIEGDVTVRENGSKRRLQNRFDYQKHVTERSSHPSAHARLAFNLLADALDNEHRAGEVHEYFVQRVMPLLPRRFTISRSRLLAYVDIIDQEKNAKIGKD
jgi:hypothetical protein